MNYQFPVSNTYEVSLVITQPSGCRDSISKSIFIVNGLNSYFTLNDSLCVGNTIILNPIIVANQFPIDSIMWVVDPGNFISFQGFTQYTFNNPGSYIIQLVVTDSSGCKNTYLDSTYVSGIDLASFQNEIICFGEHWYPNYQLNASGQSVIQTSWVNLPSGENHLDEQPPYFIPSSVGSFSIQLIASDQNGCNDESEAVLTILPKPDINIIYDEQCFNMFSFTEVNNLTNGTYHVNYSDGLEESLLNVINLNHEYLSNGTYSPSFVFIDDNGCSDTTSFVIDVNNQLSSISQKLPNIIKFTGVSANQVFNVFQVFDNIEECGDYSLHVYNRWGNLVFNESWKSDFPDLNCERCFRGYNNESVKLNFGVYFYVIELVNHQQIKGVIHFVE